MARMYTAVMAATAVSAQVDLLEINAAAGKNLELVALYISQSTDVGDAQAEGLNILIKSGQTTSGSGGTASAVLRPTSISMGTTTSAFEAGNTTKASGGTIVTHHDESWVIQAPYVNIWPEEMRIQITGGGRMTIELATTPSPDAITISCTAYLREFG